MMKTNKVHRQNNLSFLKQLDDESIDLIATDPPYNKGKVFANKAGEFNDSWDSIESYLDFMRPRIVEMHRVLKQTGSLYLQCDWVVSHHLRLMLDGVFGAGNFRNEIVWCYTLPGRNASHFPRRHDTIHFYQKSKHGVFNPQRVPYKQDLKPISEHSKMRSGKQPTNIKEREAKGKNLEDWWTDIPASAQMGREHVGYPTQKPLKLYERIIKASTNKGDLVLDPFCGSGTTLVAAQGLGRKHLGCDISKKAVKTAKKRLKAMPKETL